MQFPLCDDCLSSADLCGGCSEKLQSGSITKEAVDVSRFLFSIKDKSSGLQDAKVKNIIDSDVLIIVTGKGDAAKVVGKGGAVVKELAKKYNKSIKVLEEKDFKPFVSDFLNPITITGTNILYTPEGEVLRIRAPLSQKSKFHISDESFSKIVEQLYGKKAEIVFEE